MKERIMYVIQRADGKFYWKHRSISSCYGYDSFDKANFFYTEKGAKSRISQIVDGQECKVRQVKIVLVE